MYVTTAKSGIKLTLYCLRRVCRLDCRHHSPWRGNLLLMLMGTSGYNVGSIVLPRAHMHSWVEPLGGMQCRVDLRLFRQLLTRTWTVTCACTGVITTCTASTVRACSPLCTCALHIIIIIECWIIEATGFRVRRMQERSSETFQAAEQVSTQYLPGWSLYQDLTSPYLCDSFYLSCHPGQSPCWVSVFSCCRRHATSLFASFTSLQLLLGWMMIVNWAMAAAPSCKWLGAEATG